MTTKQVCAAGGCTKPTTAGLCHDHLTEMLAGLADTDSLFANLQVSFLRQARYSTPGGKGGGSSPLMFNEAARDALVDYTTVLLRWQGRLADHLGVPVRYTQPLAAAAWCWTAITTRGMGDWVDAGHMYDDLATTIRAVHRRIDRPRDRWYAGRCSTLVTKDDGTIVECPRELYATAETGFITCPLCRTNHPVADRRRYLLDAAEEVLLTAAEAARAVVVWTDYERGENKLVKRISKWLERGRIQTHGTVAEAGGDRPLYRLRDILDLLDQEIDAPRAR